MGHKPSFLYKQHNSLGEILGYYDISFLFNYQMQRTVLPHLIPQDHHLLF